MNDVTQIQAPAGITASKCIQFYGRLSDMAGSNVVVKKRK
jgi:hypothetical protein